MSRCSFLACVVQRIYLAKRAETTLEIVHDCTREKCLGAVECDARAPVDVVIYWGLIQIRVGEVGFLLRM